MASSSFRSRLERLKKSVIKNGLTGVIIVPGANMRYYTDVQSQMLERPFLLFVPGDGEPHLVAPNLESGPYSRAPVDIHLHQWDDASGPKGAFDSLRKEISLKGRWGCEGRVPFGYLTLIRRGPSLVPGDEVLQEIRETKDAAELGSLKKAAKLLADGFLKVPELAKPGMTELELSKALKEYVIEKGAESFDFCSVQAGVHAADPHWAPSATKLKNDDEFLIDACCTVAGYSADITRTFVLGTDREVAKVYADVLDAQQAALKAAGPKVATGAVDSAARSILEERGRGEQFFHRTGHGLGLEIHEEPYIVPGGRKLLRAGMVHTVEPGAYLAGKFGVRIEDDVVITSNGADVITGTVPKEYGWWS
jgi:Xaa-Pro dipeptidase